MKHKIAYITSRFPHRSETFILREMVEVEQMGWQVALYPLIRQKQPLEHTDARRWLLRAKNLPYISPTIIAANLRMLGQRPLLYLTLLAQVLWGTKSSLGLFIRSLALFPKAVYAATSMQAEGISHMHAHYATYPALVAWLIHKFTGISYSITVHAHDIFEQTSMLVPKLADATFIAAISEFNRNYLAEVVGPWVLDKTHIIHCGIIPENYGFKTKKRRHGEKLQIVSVGSLQPYKGQRYLIEACAFLRSRNIPFHCRIVGEGEERTNLEKLIAHHKLEVQVELLGDKTAAELTQLLAAAHCYVHPSIVTDTGKREGIPVPIMEALASGLTVVATKTSGVPELVRHEETGYLMPPANAQALADALEAIYAVPDQAIKLAENGRYLLLEQFEIRKNAQHLSKLFHEVMERQAAKAFS